MLLFTLARGAVLGYVLPRETNCKIFFRFDRVTRVVTRNNFVALKVVRVQHDV